MNDVIDCAVATHLARLYERVGKLAMHKARTLVSRQDVAQDIVHDVFEKLWRDSIVFPNERAAYIYIFKACHSRGIDILRSNARASVLNAEREITAQTSTDSFTKLANRDRIAKAVAKLSKEEATIFVFSVVDEMTQEEIAAVLEVSTKTVSRTLAKITQKLEGAR